jgi:RNA polymerase sigma-70 factor (ECF subfamily)
VSRICLDRLRTRRTRQESPLDDEVQVHVPDPLVSPADEIDPEQEVLLADSVGLALMVVLENLAPAERIAFVLHDMFSVPFDEIAPIVDRAPDATRQLASRARRRVQGVTTVPDVDLTRQRRAVDAFFAAARGGNLEALVAVLDPDIVLRSDAGPGRPLTVTVRGADAVANRATRFSDPTRQLVPVLVNGAAGVLVTTDGRPVSIMAFTVAGDRIASIDVIADPDRLAGFNLDVVVQDR